MSEFRYEVQTVGRTVHPQISHIRESGTQFNHSSWVFVTLESLQCDLFVLLKRLVNPLGAIILVLGFQRRGWL